MAIPTVLNMSPLASLAAILLLVGYKLAKPVLFKQMWKAGYVQFIPFIVTVLGIVFTDLLVGIALGMAIGIFFILYENFKNSLFVKQREEGEVTVIELSEHVTFLNKASIMKILDEIEPGHPVTIDATKCVFMHPDVHEIISDFMASEKHKADTIEYLAPTTKPAKFAKKAA
jgi:MFS superfamily sulfate permease-like transporter